MAEPRLGEPGVDRTALIVFVLLALLFVALVLWANYDLPNVVNCTDTDALIVNVDVSAARKGELIKHEFLGCDWYWYTREG
jgi:hypothetical protein